MNSTQIDFAYKVRHALNENAEQLPATITDRLASARKNALLHKKPEPVRVAVRSVALAGAFSTPFGWIGRMGLALPVLVLAAGLFGIYQVEQQQRISDLAEIDALVLSDELPLSAYLDHGFNAYLAKRVE
jgi:hypothetical protein